MRLQSITLQGFKTFAGRTTLDLRPGITAIVGPNGSGKSNIADAVRWALGETNLRHVRCRTTDELIFAGNARRSSLGLAEVSLVFANDGEWLALPFSEVRVTRRAYRSGENEYLLNGARVRLRDIVDLLAGASIHAGGHVVVGQGLVDAVLSLRPEERRPLVENLAGLKQYYLRRDEAEDRLSQTDRNLVQVASLIAEIAPQLESLELQAEVLQRHQAVTSELRQLQLATFGAQAARLRARTAPAHSHASGCLAALDAARQEAERLRDEDDALLGRLGVDRRTREALLAKVRAEQDHLTAAQREKEVASAQVQAALERSQYAFDEQARVLGSAQRERDMLTESLAALQALGAETETVTARLTASRAALESLARDRDRASAADRQAQSRNQEQAQLASRLAEAVAASRAAVEGQEQELERQAVTAAAAVEALRLAEEAWSVASAALAPREAAQVKVLAVEREAWAAFEAARRQAAISGNLLREAAAMHERLAAKHEILESWLRGSDRLDAAANELVERHGAIGIVARAVRIQQAWQAPLAALLGQRLQSVLAGDLPALIQAAQCGKGRVSLIAVETAANVPDGPDFHVVPGLAGAPRDTPLACALPLPADALAALCRHGVLTAGEVVGWAMDVSEDLTPLPVRRALGLDRVLLLRSVEALLRCRPHLASLALGSVVPVLPFAACADGSLVCGLDERAADTIKRQESFVMLAEELRQANASYQQAREAAACEQSRMAAAEERYERCRKELAGADAALSRAAEDARVQERLLGQARAVAAGAAPAAARLAGSLRERRDRLADEEEKLSDLVRQRDEARQACESSQAAVKQAQVRLSSAIAARRDDELAEARLRDRLVNDRRLVDEQRHRVAALDADLARLAERAAVANDQIVVLTARGDVAAEREAAAGRLLELANQELSPLEQRLRETEAAYQCLRAASHAADERVGQARSEYEAAQRDLEQAVRETEVLRAQVAAELQCGLTDLPEAPPPHGAVSRVRSLRAELTSIGPVNARAAADLSSARKRMDFLQLQSNDLRSGVGRLRSIIEEANSTVRDRFAATIDQLNQYFVECFQQLFGGGTCQLLAEYDTVGLPKGVEVRAQPPGKRTRDLALLSGGERALVAMALLFAMLRVRPVPFCLLDEVEAALDEANTGRFGAILRELSATTQFLVVTHNRGTMLHADFLYGVTMSETGISTVASLDLKGAVDLT